MTSKMHNISKRPIFGFSLVELMITLVLAAFLISALILTYLSGRAAAGDAEALSRVQENIRIVSEYLVRDIRNAGYTDEVETTVGQDGLMRRSFAEIENADNDVLRIRYVGRGHCAEQFNEFVLVENEYFVDSASGTLRCRGRHVPRATSVTGATDWDDGILVSERTVDLVTGVESIRFTGINPDPAGVSGCTWDYSTPASLGLACLGIEIDLRFAGIRGDVRDLTLIAAFRNVILERVNNGISSP